MIYFFIHITTEYGLRMLYKKLPTSSKARIDCSLFLNRKQQHAITHLSQNAGPQPAAHFWFFNKTYWRQQVAVNDMLVWGPRLYNTFRISHNGQLPMSPAFISSMCHWTVKSKDTWHHMFPCAVMTAPSTAFIAASLWRLDQGHVQASIRAAGKSLPFLAEASFTWLTPHWYCIYLHCAPIFKKKIIIMWAAVWNLQQNPWGALRRKRQSKIYEQQEVRTEREEERKPREK